MSLSMQKYKIVLIGAGNIARQLMNTFEKSPFEVIQIFNRSIQSARDLGLPFGVPFETQPSKIDPGGDVYIICIKDDSIRAYAEKLQPFIPSEAHVVHTSGLRPISDLDFFSSHGLFYPLHSFTKEEIWPFDHIPLILNANNDDLLGILKEIAITLSDAIYILSDEQRPYLHLAAVLANNFTNHLIGRAFELLDSRGIDQSILHPILDGTFRKALNNHPYKIQTGPAIRKDETTIRKHIELLSSDTELGNIYALITNSIQNTIE